MPYSRMILGFLMKNRHAGFEMRDQCLYVLSEGKGEE
jgi:hypothetical protein